jgi:Flp pilus assembly pilin Flp
MSHGGSNNQPNKFKIQTPLGGYMSIQTIKSFWQEDAGQDLVEYSLLLGFLALGSLALLSSAGTSVKSIWSTISTNLSSAAATAGS